MSGRNRSLFQSRLSRGLDHNPELIRMANKFRMERLARRVATEERERLEHEVSFLEKLDHRLDKTIKGKQKQLDFVVKVKERQHHDAIKKHYLQKLKMEQQESNATIAQQIKAERQIKIRACEANSRQKKLLAEKNKKEKMELENQRNINYQEELRRNRSTASKISKFKNELKQSRAQLRKTREKQYLSNYEFSIRAQKEKREESELSTSQLSSKMRMLTESTSRKSLIFKELDSVIRTVKRSGTGQCSGNYGCFKRRSTLKDYSVSSFMQEGGQKHYTISTYTEEKQ